jgi:hypothetical protein
MNLSSKVFRGFRITILLTLLALVLEFILGMYTSLFVEFPDSLSNGDAWGWSMAQSPVITAHVVLGSLLVVASLAALGFGIALKNRSAIASTAVGLLLMLIAYLSGGVFLSNVQMDAYSFLMALAFMGTMLAYGTGFYLTRQPDQV